MASIIKHKKSYSVVYNYIDKNGKHGIPIKRPSVSRKNRKVRTQFVTNQTIEKIIKLLRCAFKQAVRWELIGKNVHIEDENIAADNAYIYIEAELTRASKQAIETLGEKDIIISSLR